ncbi:allantoate deiminase [Sporolactobacillus spathodeae]|uniref:Allantoate deiminase n=1 Tax=Sporolactobacillus spathodeae TaxID=1465502 RepID=A0ABS2Q8V9_9BACL|nr:allantoate deiminase [Sporolactobacillus spathodeae]
MTIDQEDVTEHAGELDYLIQWLSAFGQTENGGVTRLLYDKAWREAQSSMQDKMRELGFSTYFDDVGNLFGRIQGTENTPNVILTGSHIDTVIDGGKYDGAYGILAALLAASRLVRKYGMPKRTVEVVSLCEEEGSRFPLSFWGSGNITGKYNAENALKVADTHGVTLLNAMQAAGFGKGDHVNARRSDIDCFIETHIEQGRILELEKKCWAPVSHIVGQRRYTVSLSGKSNHAGTTPMYLRKDALYAAAQMIAEVVHRAEVLHNGLTTTCGSIVADPNVSNVIAGSCRFSLDIRHHQTDVLEQFSAAAIEFFKSLANQSGIGITIDKWMDVEPVQLDPGLTEMNFKIGEKAGIPIRKMISGAGHDAQIFGNFCPTALLFVPSHNGISHSPEEYTDTEALEIGIQMLMRVLFRLAYN